MGRAGSASIAMLIAVALGACAQQGASGDGMALLAKTEKPTPAMVEGLKVLQQACPSLASESGNYVAMPAESGDSLASEREFGGVAVIRYKVEITQPLPTKEFSVGHNCEFDVSSGSPAGVIVTKEPCIRLCDHAVDPTIGYYVKRI